MSGNSACLGGVLVTGPALVLAALIAHFSGVSGDAQWGVFFAAYVPLLAAGCPVGYRIARWLDRQVED